jgi:proton-dependent oligopeptide transporter, POT family
MMMTTAANTSRPATLFGHPPGLFTLFFAEMWERFSYYGMRALLLFYMLKGFLGYTDGQAYAVYGSYTALVYMTPFFGGMLADRLLGARRAVVLGGLFMAAGHLLMTVQTELAFFGALALLIVGNGFFKPNISTMVGALYAEGSPKRDGGFTIFYMGINLGAAMSPLLCGYIGETYGWHYGFGLATLGMLIGLAVFVAPIRVTQGMIATGALGTAVSLFVFRPDNPFYIAVNVFVALSLLAAAGVACVALGRGGLPAQAGLPPDPSKLRAKLGGGLSAEWSVYLGALVVVPLFAMLVAGFAPLTSDHAPLVLFSEEMIASLHASPSAFSQVLAVVVEEISKPAGLVLMATGLSAIIYLATQMVKLPKLQRERLQVAVTLIFFSMLFWAFFEQAGSSINNFTDRNVNRVQAAEQIGADDVGKTIRLQPTQKQLGYHDGTRLFTQKDLDQLRAREGQMPDFEVDWTVAPDNVGMGIAKRTDEVPASVFQSVNAVCILLFGLVFAALWSYLGTRRIEPSTPLKFALGLLQLGLGFGALWYGAQSSDSRGMVAVGWLLLGYLLHTTGELCLSPVGLSMITRLSPAQLVSTMMGTWFLASAFSGYLGAIISQFTNTTAAAGGEQSVPIPLNTVHVYGDVFGKIALAALISAAICLALVPLLKRWMHERADGSEPEPRAVP